MHELSITQEITEAIRLEARRNGARKVHRVRVKVGVLTGFDPEVIQYYYELLTNEDELLSGSKLTAELDCAKLFCKDCGKESLLCDFIRICPNCGSANTVVEGGNEVLIDSMEVD